MWWLMALVVCAGGLVAVQAAVNSYLGRSLSNPVLAALISFVVGTTTLVALFAAGSPELPRLSAIRKLPPWAWIGGFIGAFYVGLAVVATPRLGVATTICLAIAGQMAISLLLDHFGWFELARRPVTVVRLLGVVLIACGVILVRRA
jgi:transporter family-2 protein